MRRLLRRFWAWPSELRELGVLGMNRRNAEFILPHNPRRHYRLLDDKLQTKKICEAHGIPVPETYDVIGRQGDARRFAESGCTYPQFVVKPAQGSEGRGILVIAGRCQDGWLTSGGNLISRADMQYHLSAILAGLYSLGGQPDRAVVEERIDRHHSLAGVAVEGTPDIRVIVYRKVPAMAMIRLPTRASRGRANLHQGAVAAGIDLSSGRTVGGVCRGRVVERHPDTQGPIGGLVIPFWSDLLRAAILLAAHLEMGYIGIDFVLAPGRGPVVLEANARPGLAIQLANRSGLLHRLRAIDRQLLVANAQLASEQPSPERELDLVARIAPALVS